MSIAPIVRTVTVAIPRDRAFAVFTGDMGRWWKPGHTVGARPFVDIVIEPRAGGRWYERDAEGDETQWGKVIAWDPPRRVLMAWQLDATFVHDPDFVTEVEIRFDDQDGATKVTLEHRGLERFGPSAEKVAGQLAGGWPTQLELFARFIQQEAQA